MVWAAVLVDAAPLGAVPLGMALPAPLLLPDDTPLGVEPWSGVLAVAYVGLVAL